jgi:hypothetical protein
MYSGASCHAPIVPFPRGHTESSSPLNGRLPTEAPLRKRARESSPPLAKTSFRYSKRQPDGQKGWLCGLIAQNSSCEWLKSSCMRVFARAGLLLCQTLVKSVNIPFPWVIPRARLTSKTSTDINGLREHRTVIPPNTLHGGAAQATGNKRPTLFHLVLCRKPIYL